MSTRTTGTEHRDLRLVLGEMARELATPDPDEITARHDLDELRRQVRESKPEIHNHVTIEAPSRHHSSSPPSAPSLDAHIPLLGHWKAKGLKAIVAVLVVAALVVLAVAAVKSAAVGREVPAGRAKD